MPYLTQPTDAVLDAFLAREREQPFSYSEVGFTLSEVEVPVERYNLDHNRIQIGQGSAAFDAACDALRRWRQFPPAWTRIYPADTPLAAGQVVAMVCRVFGLWWLNSCRIVYTLDENENGTRRFGFAYGTLPGHVEQGEERFSVELDEQQRVWYDLRAFSRPCHWAPRLAYPLARQQQRRFVKDSQAALQAAVTSATDRS